MIDHSRRELLRSGLLFTLAPPLLSAQACSDENNRGLGVADDNAVRLLPGFRSRVIARSGEPVIAGNGYTWHDAPDGGACMPYVSIDGGGWVYLSNSEIDTGGGGAGAIRFDSSGDIVDAYSILQNTTRNCAGGLMPWDTWLSCEEFDDGLVWECDPLGIQAAVVRPALGRFNHEAVAADPAGQRLYLTEDKPDGGLYRFTPDSWGDLSSGLLEVATEVDATATGLELGWEAVPDPDAGGVPTRHQVLGTALFDGGEGIVYHDGKVFFTTKGDNSVWELELSTSLAVRIYDDDDYAAPVLTGVDNITADTSGNLFVAEDGGDLQVVMLAPSGTVLPVAQVVGHGLSEITGVAFSPDGSRLYFSSQRGPGGASSDGVTYEISGPFDTL